MERIMALKYCIYKQPNDFGRMTEASWGAGMVNWGRIWPSGGLSTGFGKRSCSPRDDAFLPEGKRPKH